MNLQCVLIERPKEDFILQLQLNTGHFIDLPISKKTAELIKESKPTIGAYDLTTMGVTHWDTKGANYSVPKRKTN